jgi:hypothetical protein
MLNLHRLTSYILLNSSSLLLADNCLLACLLTYVLTHSLIAYFFRICSPMKMRHRHASQKTHVTWCYALLCDITAHAPVERAKRKHMPHDRDLLLCEVTTDTKKTQLPLLLRVGTRSRSHRLAMGITLQYLKNMAWSCWLDSSGS